MRYLLVALALSFTVAFNSGCSKGLPTLTPQMAAKRDLLVLKQEPADSLTVKAARAAIADNQDSEVIIAGVIGGDEKPWDQGKASFMITQVGGAAAAHDHDHEHAGHDHGDHDHADHADHKHGDEADHKDGDKAEHKHAEGEHAHDHAGHDHAAHDHADHDHAGHDHEHAHGEAGHDHDNCPFCQRAKKKGNLESCAIVQFVDADGSVLAVDSRELFGVREKQKVVVKGRAKIDDLGNLIVSATGIYIAKP